MRSFLKIFFASFLALVVFVIIGLLLLVGWVGNLASAPKEETGSNAVLVLDLNQAFHERTDEDPLSGVSENRYDVPGLYDVIRLIRFAKSDSSVKGIYLKCDGNLNGFSASEEIRDALADFKKSGKFTVAYGDVISLKGYCVGNIADKIYCNPKGGVEWKGLSYLSPFLKGSLDKLEIQPQIFYAGKFKSATEPLRADKMTDANRVQITSLLNDIYNRILLNTALARNQDTATLRRCVDLHLIQYAQDALTYKLVDGLKYDDEVRSEIQDRLKTGSSNINFVSIGKYAQAVRGKYKADGKDRIALIYAEGDVTGGKNDEKEIGEEAYRTIIRKARQDKDIKAIVLRVNSGGGSALVSENLWRELTLAKQSKPVVISFGDVSASGAYYLSCNADSIFAEPDCITGSIGVFSVIPNTQQFFKDKLGVTFDGVQTAREPDAISMFQPLTEFQRRFLQSSVDSIYLGFKTRVANGRRKDIQFIDSIAQGRVWSGQQALQLGLIDRSGSIQDAVDCAARMAKTSDYRLREYPEPKGLVDLLLNNYKKSVKMQAMKDELGTGGMQLYDALSNLRSGIGLNQARLPFDLLITEK
jgi:protease IV